MNSRLEKFAFAILAVAFSFGILTLWIPELWPWAVFQSIVLFTAGICLTIYAWRPARVPVSGWLFVPLVPAAIGAGQLVFSKTVETWQTRQTIFEWTTYAAAAFLAFVVCRKSRLRHMALRTFVVAASALALLSTIQNYAAPGRVLWLFDSGFNEAVFGPFVYHTKLANFAELAIPAAVWLAVVDESATPYLTCMVVLAGSVVAAASRGGIAVLGLEFLVLGTIAARRCSRRGVLATALALGAILACGSAVFGWQLAAHRFTAVSAGDDLRWPLAMTSLEMAQRYWLTGSGLGTWSTVYPEFARFDLHLFINQAHCDWLQWLVEGGVWLPACMLLMLAAAMKAARREWWTLGLPFVWLHGAIDYPMQQTPTFACLQIAFWGAAMAVLSRRKLTHCDIIQPSRFKCLLPAAERSSSWPPSPPPSVWCWRNRPPAQPFLRK